MAQTESWQGETRVTSESEAAILSTKKKRHCNYILKYSIQISQKFITQHSPSDFKPHQNYITDCLYHLSLVSLTLNLTKIISLITHRLTCCGIHRKIRSVQGFHWDFLKIVSFFTFYFLTWKMISNHIFHWDFLKIVSFFTFHFLTWNMISSHIFKRDFLKIIFFLLFTFFR